MFLDKPNQPCCVTYGMELRAGTRLPIANFGLPLPSGLLPPRGCA